MLKLTGKTAVITGGNSGIGLAIAQRFIGQGARVFIAGRRQDKLDEAVKSLGPAAEGIQCDVTSSEDIARLFSLVAEKVEQVDILVAASGIGGGAPLNSLTEEHFDQLFATNVRGLVFTVREGVRLMKQGGSIILLGSIAGKVNPAGYGTYSATKAAVSSYGHAWSKELTGQGIRVNILSPGPTETPIFDGVSTEVRQSFIDKIPMKRIGQPEEIASAALFFASEDSSFVTGTEMFVDGGLTA
ncbi:oxidoreductase [Tatumella morbirosei]|uniref:Oxidoreductase n=1 Tax=Tatumella morbirosei TaxID=642227 RepID=A0A095VD64_9GAMM|nr:SDR family oxidoreductase [Tatumella morbirosei]KGD72590.1 oxidoreductase [Tatumella morbirosei]